jgi:acylphosphatase
VVIRRRVIISGAVQGVAFRDSCRRVAIEHGVSGWVRNLADSTVEAVFEGPEDAVGRLVEWSHHGPRTAAVESVNVLAEPAEDLAGFEIRSTPRRG